MSLADLGLGVQSDLPISDSPFNRFGRFRRAFNEFSRLGLTRNRRSIALGGFGERSISLADLGVQ